MAQTSITVVCPACNVEFELFEFDTQTALNVGESQGHGHRMLSISLLGQMEHDDCSAQPA